MARLPYGYRPTGRFNGQRLPPEPDPELRPIVQRIFRDVRAGKTPGDIAKALNAAGVVSPQRGEWFPSTVRRIVSNDAYLRLPVIVTERTWSDAQHAISRQE